MSKKKRKTEPTQSPPPPAITKPPWTFEISTAAERSIEKLKTLRPQDVLDFLEKRIGQSGDPRSHGEALRGSQLGDLWRYRMGDFRIIADIVDKKCVVVVVRVGNRKEIYR